MVYSAAVVEITHTIVVTDAATTESDAAIVSHTTVTAMVNAASMAMVYATMAPATNAMAPAMVTNATAPAMVTMTPGVAFTFTTASSSRHLSLIYSYLL